MGLCMHIVHVTYDHVPFFLFITMHLLLGKSGIFQFPYQGRETFFCYMHKVSSKSGREGQMEDVPFSIPVCPDHGRVKGTSRHVPPGPTWKGSEVTGSVPSRQAATCAPGPAR
jgi:hypothetical protein